jgi:hypothetical protein
LKFLHFLFHGHHKEGTVHQNLCNDNVGRDHEIQPIYCMAHDIRHVLVDILNFAPNHFKTLRLCLLHTYVAYETSGFQSINLSFKHQQRDDISANEKQIDLVTRWNSTYMMLYDTLKIFDHIGIHGHQSFGVNKEDVANHRRLCDKFRCFAMFAKVLCLEFLLKFGMVMPIYNNLYDILKEYSKLLESCLFKKVPVISSKDLFKRKLPLTELYNHEMEIEYGVKPIEHSSKFPGLLRSSSILSVSMAVNDDDYSNAHVISDDEQIIKADEVACKDFLLIIGNV